jgi:heme/copper-type cytochrome/quinol oxidase subunit 2
MSRNGRIALIAAALVVAVVAFVVLRSGGSDSGGSDSVSRDSDNRDSGSRDSGRTGSRTPAAPEWRIGVRQGEPVGGVHKITVTKGDTVRLTVSSPDTSQEIHVHGYDLSRDMAPGRPVSFRFKTTIEGAFEIELEETSTKIANLLVQPG